MNIAGKNQIGPIEMSSPQNSDFICASNTTMSNVLERNVEKVIKINP
jgi:hypothetical protein